MTEYQILNMFWMQAISNAMFQLGVFVLLWAALRGSLRIYDQGANLPTKIISSLFGLGIVYSGLQISGFFSINWRSASYSLGQLLLREPSSFKIFNNSKLCLFPTSKSLKS